MKVRTINAVGERTSKAAVWLSSPRTNSWCFLGWLVATALFVAVTGILGGLTEGDANVSVYLTWVLAHGHVACGYPPSKIVGYAPTAPLYPLIAGGVTALLRIGGHVPFPTTTQLGAHCTNATSLINHWALTSHAWLPTLRIGFLGWFARMAGIVALLRASGRGRCGWEALALIVAAGAPPVAMCLAEYFHPQDLVALGLALVGLACARKGSWIRAGVFLGLALVTQQFILLVFIPILMAAPYNRLTRFLGATLVSGALIAVPLIILTSGRALTSVLVGTGEASTTMSLLDLTRLHGSALFVTSRFLPLAFSLILAWWASRKLGPTLIEPIPLLSLVAMSLCFRLVFEVNVWGYYFMAAAVTLVVLDVMCGRIRLPLLMWIALVTLAAVQGGLISGSSKRFLPIWSWQLVLVSCALVLASTPLFSYVAAVGETKQDPMLNRDPTQSPG